MKSLNDYRLNWSGGSKTPSLSSMHWNLLAIPAAVLAVMAILQAISFGKFKDWIEGVRIGWPAVVAVVIILAELWGAICLLRLPLSPVVRFMGVALAVLVSGFWFVENLYVTSASSGQLPSSAFFGKYLSQSPGWWTVLEVSLLLFWVIYAAELLKWRPGNR
jgi:hypothetical protein